MKLENKRIGLIGVGLLGGAIAERLLQHGFVVSGFDLDRGRLDALEAMGGKACRDADDVFTACETVLLSLPTSEIVCELLSQDVTGVSGSLTIVDTTTGDPRQMTAFGESLLQRGIDYVEANVAGSSEQLRDGRAMLLVGGEESTVARLEHLFASIADKHFHLGRVGSASRFKLVHNLILGLHRAVLAEGLTFADSLGFEPAVALEILRQTPAASAVMDTKGPKMVSADYEPQARLSQHLKDVRLILAEADRVGTKIPLSELHQSLLQTAEQLGFGGADNSAVIEAFRPSRAESDEC